MGTPGGRDPPPQQVWGVTQPTEGPEKSPSGCDASHSRRGQPRGSGVWELGETIKFVRSLSELLVFWSWMVFMSPNSNHPEES